MSALMSVGQREVAKIIGKDESVVSRMKDGPIKHTAATLAACGLKVVPASAKCFEPHYIEALRMLAKQALEEPANASLEWD